MKFQRIPLIVKSLLAEVLPRGMGKTVTIDQLHKTKNPFKLLKVLQYRDTSERIKLLLGEIVKYSDILENDNLSLLQRVVYRNHYNRIMGEYSALTDLRDKLAIQMKLYSRDDNVTITVDELRDRYLRLSNDQTHTTYKGVV